MLTFFRLTAFSVLALTVFGGEAAFADAPSAINQAPQVAEAEAKIAPEDEPICYEVLTNNTTLNLSSLCNRTSKDSQVSSTPTRTRTPYNFTAIKKYNDEVYGEDN
ncbi:MAG: hypothetical protein KME05_16925 [Gloeocapsa sp. UFS-A4-WI-NPMV-4B04]|jgi:hypothetical protein|nr:hypothetical protein [Gloeocapsa sp. UFS-A4-WI-NPMV-4B04]